ncbi:MAG: flap structure-specific endonuclease, partial [Candidatus Thermoplasmatota archaeon]|nr:flap structure-specific endonuclease [Candidatus Thermoplasmatota archaeon]
MGVELGSLVPAETLKMEELSGKVLFFDGNNVLYQFLSIIRGPDGTPLKDRRGRVTSHLAGLMYRTANLVEAGILPVFVWDGKPDERKAGTLDERRERREEAAKAAEAARERGDLETARTKAVQSARL